MLGPDGIEEVGQTIMQNSQYAVQQLNQIEGIKGSRLVSPFFKEFIVDFNNTGLQVSEINQQLIERKVFGGKDLSQEFPEFGQAALFCVTEVHTKEDIDYLVQSIHEIVSAAK